MYKFNYYDLFGGGIVGYLVGIFGDTIKKGIIKKIDRFRLKRQLDKISEKNFENILALDHAETSYHPIDIELRLSSASLYYSTPIEFKDTLINLFTARAFKKRDLGLNNFLFSTIPNISHQLDVNKRLVALEFIKSTEKIHPLFNGQKLGVYKLKIKRDADSERGKLIIDLFKTDYYTHKVSRSLYRWMNSSTNIASQIDLNFFNNNFENYRFLNTSLGIYIVVQVEEGFVFCKRSQIVSNSEEANKWHVSVDEGLDMKDLNNNNVDILRFAERGLAEELGLTRSVLDKYIDGKIKFLDFFLEKKRYELIISSYVKLNMTMAQLKEFYNTAKDGEYETVDITCVENDFSTLQKFFKKNSVTDMAIYCVDRILARGIL